MRRALFALLLASCARRPPAVAPIARAPAPVARTPSRDGVWSPPSVPARRGRVAPAPLPVGDGPVGTGHRARSWLADPDGRWVVLCQSRRVPPADAPAPARAAVIVAGSGYRRQEAMRPYLVVQGGEGVAIDGAIAQADRWLVYRRETRVLLRDATDGAEVDLSPRSLDVTDEGVELVPPGVASVAANGRRMVYLRDEGGEVQTVVRDLPGGEPRVLDPVPEEVTHLWISSDGAWVARGLARATDLAGRPIPPRARTHVPPPDCLSEWRTLPGPGWRETMLVEPAAGGPRWRVDGVLGLFGDDLLVRRGDALGRLGRDGRHTEIAPAWCRARVQGWHPTRRVLLLACTRAGANTTAPLQVYDDRGRRSLGLRVAAGESDAAPSHVALVTLPRARGYDVQRWISLDTLRALPAGDEYVGAEYGSRFLARQGDRLVVRDFDDTSRVTVLPRFPAGPISETYGRHLLMGDHLVDLWEGRVRGPVAPPLVVTREGRALVPVGHIGNDPVGPFTWRLAPEVGDGTPPPPAVSPPNDLDAGSATDASAGHDVDGDVALTCRVAPETLDEAADRFVRSRLREVHRCYERALTAHPGVGGRVVVTFTFGPEGYLTRVSSDGLPTAPEFGTCVADFFRPLPLGLAPGCPWEVSFPFALAPSG